MEQTYFEKPGTALEAAVLLVECTLPGHEIFLIHERAECAAPAEALLNLTEYGQGQFAALLKAQVREIRMADQGVELVVDGIAPELLTALKDAFAAHEQAEREMEMV